MTLATALFPKTGFNQSRAHLNYDANENLLSLSGPPDPLSRALWEINDSTALKLTREKLGVREEKATGWTKAEAASLNKTVVSSLISLAPKTTIMGLFLSVKGLYFGCRFKGA